MKWFEKICFYKHDLLCRMMVLRISLSDNRRRELYGLSKWILSTIKRLLCIRLLTLLYHLILPDSSSVGSDSTAITGRRSEACFTIGPTLSRLFLADGTFGKIPPWLTAYDTDLWQNTPQNAAEILIDPRKSAPTPIGQPPDATSAACRIQVKGMLDSTVIVTKLKKKKAVPNL